MKKIKYILFLSALFFVASFSARAQYYSDEMVKWFYESAARSNTRAISRMLNLGYSIDDVDANGNTALCVAIYKNNMAAARILKRYGANTRHPCVKAAMAGKSNFGWNTGYTIGAVALAGGAVAAIAAGGSGGGSSKSANSSSGDVPSGGDNGGGNGGDNGGGNGGGNGGDNGGNNGGDNGGGNGGDNGGGNGGDNGGDNGGGNGGDNGGGNGGDNGGGNGGGNGGDNGGGNGGDNGGGNGGDNGGDNGGGNGGDNGGGNGGGNGGTTNNDLTPSYFETNEYGYGRFLPLINASTAYARLYQKDEDGNLVSELNDVYVGTIDTGIYNQNIEFEQTNISGINRDYGPCRNGDTTNCWKYSLNRALLYDGSGQVIDMIAMTHSEYNDWASEYADDYDWDENNYLPGTSDSSRHGTHVAGIIAADKNDFYMHGVAFSNAKLIGTKWDFLSSLSDAMVDTIDAGAQIINMSLGVDASASVNATKVTEPSNLSYLEDFVLNGMRYAANKDVVIVMSAGNEAYAEPGLYNGIPLIPEFSTSLENLFITVVSVGNDGVMPSYSNKCGSTAAYCIAAPGGTSAEKIRSTGTYDQVIYGGYGTSMAAGVVAGSVALLMGAYPYMTPQQVVELIFETANKEGVYADSSIYGNGMLDLAEATNPQGYLATVSGNSVNSQRVNTASTRMEVPSVFQQPLQKHMPKTMTAFDKYNRPFQVSMPAMVKSTHGGERNFKRDLYNFSRRKDKQKVSSGNFAFGYAPSSYNNHDGGMGFVSTSYATDDYASSFFFAENSQYAADSYHDKATFNPFLAMNQVYGLKNDIYFDDFTLKFSFMTGENGLYDGDKAYNDYDFDDRAYAFDMNFEYYVKPNLALNLMGGILSEDNALLGMNGRGALDIDDTNTVYAGIMLSWEPLENLTLSGAYYHGWTDPMRSSGSMMSTSRLLSDSFAFDAHYNFNKTDVLGFQISSPLRVYKGAADFDIAVGRDNYSDTVYRENVRAGLKPSAREYMFALYHNRELWEKVMMKSEMAVRLNPDHQASVDPDYRAMFGLSWDF